MKFSMLNHDTKLLNGIKYQVLLDVIYAVWRVYYKTKATSSNQTNFDTSIYVAKLLKGIETQLLSY